MNNKKQNFKTFLYILLILLAIAGITAVGYGIYLKATRNIPRPVASIKIKDYGTIKVELYPDQAPNTVANFIRLANRGYYKNKTFFRTIPDFMIQGGELDATSGASLSDIQDNGADENYTIPGEFLANGYSDNKIQFERGTIGMARADYSSISQSLATEGYNSACSQFFIMQADQSDTMNGLYAGFGKVIEGMEIVDSIANLEVVTRDENADDGVDEPVNPPVIEDITVETYGADYGMPETLEPFDYNTWLLRSYGYTV